ncbi:MAG: type II secretion system GspH family protein [Planctomycetes bacterium]|nr:type II secretion system GspH family protein [Planctomycetota bacterium]
MRRVQRGFTLIEVLVVVSILGVLAGLISVLITQAQKKRLEFETTNAITFVRNAVDTYKNDMGRLPPETMAGFAGTKWAGLAVTGNTTNECIECLLVALRHPDLRSKLDELPGSEPFGNTDDDIWNKVPEGSDAPEAKEILDAYGNPIIYITKNRYEETIQIALADGTPIEVRAVRRSSGAFYNQDGYQLISLGRNGKQDPDEKVDDIENFQREGE